MVEISWGSVVVVFKKGMALGVCLKVLLELLFLLFKRGAKAVGKRALKAATEVGQDVLEGKDVLKSLKSRGSEDLRSKDLSTSNRSKTQEKMR